MSGCHRSKERALQLLSASLLRKKLAIFLSGKLECQVLEESIMSKIKITSWCIVTDEVYDVYKCSWCQTLVFNDQGF